MVTKAHQYSAGKENLYFFYRFIVLPWEIEWVNCKFLMSEGDLRNYCQKHNINIKSFESADKLGAAIAKEYSAEEIRFNGILWFVRQDTKPKDTLRHLRNCFAHGSYRKRQKNKAQCIVIENIHNKKIKAKGFMPLYVLNGLIRAASSCGV